MEPITVDKIILHPGSPKTGTSSLQNYLYRKRDELLSRGYLYPTSGIPKEGGAAKGHHHLALALDYRLANNGPSSVDIIEQLRAEINASNVRKIIISSEELFGSRRLEELKSVFNTRNCDAYVCLRPQHEVLNANYYTQVSYNRSTLSPDGYFDIGQRNMHYQDVLSVVSQFAKYTDMRLSLFEKGRPARISPVQDFLTQMKIPLTFEPSENVIEHPTLPAQATLFLRFINEMQYEAMDYYEVFQCLHRMRSEFSDEKYTMSPERIRATEQRFDAENREIRRKYFDGQDQALFAPAVVSDAGCWARDIGTDPMEIERAILKNIIKKAAAHTG